jgi:hypothetical protein
MDISVLLSIVAAVLTVAGFFWLFINLKKKRRNETSISPLSR